MLGYHECDDANNENGDGCNADCQLEDCWFCDTTVQPSNCYIAPSLAIGIDSIQYDKDMDTVSIHFNNSIILQPGYDIYNAISIDVTGPLEPYNMSWYLEDADPIFQMNPVDKFVLQMQWFDT